jgi:phosphohistidine phosphatase
MIQLTLVRHAAAESAPPGGSDADRALSPRGRREAPDVARRVLRAGVRPETILSSTALRAASTASVFAEVLGATVAERDELYGADADDILAVAREHGAAEVLLVAHDPGLSALATTLAGREVRMAPSAAAIFTWHEGGWEAVGTASPDEVELVDPH